jgi:hypothetical protein
VVASDDAPTDVPVEQLNPEQRKDVRQRTWSDVVQSDAHDAAEADDDAASTTAQAGWDAESTTAHAGGTRHQTPDRPIVVSQMLV